MTDELEELNQAVQFNFDDITQIETELQHIDDKNLQEQAIFFKNYALMNDCKITKEFIRLESRKRSYCHIVKLILPNEDKDKEPDKVNKPAEIRTKMALSMHV